MTRMLKRVRVPLAESMVLSYFTQTNILQANSKITLLVVWSRKTCLKASQDNVNSIRLFVESNLIVVLLARYIQLFKKLSSTIIFGKKNCDKPQLCFAAEKMKLKHALSVCCSKSSVL